MNPYYSDEFVTLYHGDSLGDAARFWRVADVLVTDPPYGIAVHSNHKRQIEGDKDTSARDGVLAIWNSRPAIVFGRWDVGRPANTRARLIWDKGNTVGMGDLSLPWGRAEEEIYVLGKGFTGKRESNVIRSQMLMSSDRERPDHPTPKPVGLMERLIAKTTGRVADPFAGSGATLIAARNLGRKVIGVEIEERYCELIATRLSQGAFDLMGGVA